VPVCRQQLPTRSSPRIAVFAVSEWSRDLAVYSVDCQKSAITQCKRKVALPLPLLLLPRFIKYLSAHGTVPCLVSCAARVASPAAVN